MAWTAKKVSVLAGTLALLTEAGLNNAFVIGLVYTAASGAAAPIIVHGVVAAHNAEQARLDADRANYSRRRSAGRRPSSTAEEPGDADQVARQSDEDTADSPDMPRRLGPMLVARRVFLNIYEGDPNRARLILGSLDGLLRDDRRAFASFARRAARDPGWEAAHRADLADLRAMEVRLDRLRTQALAE